MFFLSSPKIEILRVDNNNLNGTIPSELATLTDLEELSLMGGSLRGTLPTEFGQLTKMEKLYLAFNSELSGTIPESYAQNFRKLQSMWIQGTMLSGTLHSEFFEIPSLDNFVLGSNMFTGTIPDLSPESGLEIFYAEDNVLTGSIPESFYNSSTIELISLWGNQLTGTLSSRIGGTNIFYLDVEVNNLSGTIPTEIGLLSEMLYLYLSSNHFVGTIPSEIGQLTGLRFFWIHDNELTGTIPIVMADLPSTSQTYWFNNFTGSLDAFCAQKDPFMDVHADCHGDDPQVECPCCNKCCDPVTKDCAIYLEAVCEKDRKIFEDERGPRYVEGAGTVCECTGSGPNVTLSCSDKDCVTCNRDETVCVSSIEFGSGYNERGERSSWWASFEYVVGRSDTVEFQKYVMDDYSSTCQASVNGQLCDTCGIPPCNDGYQAYHINCASVDGAGYVDQCDEWRPDDDGPLAVFAFQDRNFRQGCPPRFDFDL